MIIRRLRLLAVTVVVAACNGQVPAPTATSTPPGAAPPSPIGRSAPTPTRGSTADPSATIAHRPLVAYQRWASDIPGIGLVSLDGADDHALRIDGTPSQDMAHPDWAQGGNQIAFDVAFDDPGQTLGARVEPWIVAVEGGTAERLTSCQLPCLQLAYPTFSPDGQRVALIRYDVGGDGAWGPSALEILDLATGERRTVSETADGREAWYFPRWSADGRQVVFVVETYIDAGQETYEGMALGVLDVDGSGERPSIITPPDIYPRDVDWSWATDRLVVSVIPTLTSPMEDAQLVTMQPDGSGRSPLPVDGDGAFAYQASWAPTGDRLIFTTQVPGGKATHGLTHADGTRFSVISGDGTVRTHPRIQPLAP